MANEAIPVEGPYDIHDVTVADGTAITQYTILELTDPRTGAANNGSGDVFGGIAMSEKAASDGTINMGAAFSGIFKLTSAVGPTIPAGVIVSTSGPNLIKAATEAEIAAGKGIGKTMEEMASNTQGEVKLLGF